MADQNLSGQFRRPLALAELADGRLCVANRRSGTVSLIDIWREHTVAEISIGRRLSDLAILPDGRHLLVTDEECHQLILLKYDGDQMTVVERLEVSPYPVSLQVSNDGQRCFVASLWSRTLTIVDLRIVGETATEPTDEAVTSMAVSRTVTLPFEPREQLYLAEHHKLLVADAFGGHMAMLDTGDGAIDSVREIPGHNVRGLALERDGRHVLVSQQILNPLAPTDKIQHHLERVVCELSTATVGRAAARSIRGRYEG